MNFSVARRSYGAALSREPWPLAGALLLAGLIDALLVAAVGYGLLASPQAFALHAGLVLGVALAFQAWPLGDGDILAFAVAALLFAGPLGALASVCLAVLVALETGTRRDAPSAPETRRETGEVDRLVEELRTARSIAADGPKPPSFLKIMKSGSLSERLAVLGVVATSYHPEHRRVVELALRSDSAGVRAQAAALVVSLQTRARAQLARALEAGDDAERQLAETVACLRSGFLEPAQAASARDAAIALCRTARRASDTRGPLTETLIALLLDSGAHEEAAAELATLDRMSLETRSRCLAAFLKDGRLDAARDLLARRDMEGARPC